MELIKKYFSGLSPLQEQQFGELQDLYRFWNDQINVISRLDADNLYERHVLHSLGIAKVITFKPMTEILDVGTGGGFPG
ncbi:MAG: class I SAM-dependent methyltransferase, partial [Siphonobacter sp.]